MYINVNHYNSALQSLVNASSQAFLCPTNPVSYADANSSKLGANTGSLSLSISSYSSGQKIQCSAFNASISTSGTANVLVFVGNNDIQAKVYIEPMPVVSGETDNISSFDLWKMENPSF